MRIIRTNTLGIRVDSIGDDQPTSHLLEAFAGSTRAALFTFVNPASVVAAQRNPHYRQLLDEFDAVLPDGIGMCWAVRLLHGHRTKRVSFDTTSLAPLVFHRARQCDLTVALVGGRPGVVERAADQLAKAYPGLAVTAMLHGYGDHAGKIRELKELSPSVVICGMGVGAQERFLVSLAATGWSGLGFTCGGYLDQLASGLHYYPSWVDATNLRWVYRLMREPRRLARRYFVDYSYFAAHLGRALIARRTNPDQDSPPLAAEFNSPDSIGDGQSNRQPLPQGSHD
jgi:N-acetylglucosaminyldiphosphoundecaprenol N-acetyl-beta-D-mannosaminyltransferase